MTGKNHAPGGALVQAWVDLQDTGNAQSQLLLNALARFVDWRTGKGYPGLDALAEIGKCSRKTCKRHLARMSGDGIITIAPRHVEEGSDRGRQTSNEITFIGYQEWAVANRDGGAVRKPRKARRYTLPEDPEPEGGGGQPDPEGEGVNLTPRGGQPDPEGEGVNLTPLEQLKEPSEELSPPTPPGAREGGNSISIFGWIEDLRAEGQPGLVLDELLVPMLSAGLKPWKDTDPCGPARQLCADFRRRSGPVLRAAADRLLDSERYRLPPVARFREAVAAEGKIAADAARNQVKRTAAEGDDLERFGRDTPEFQAALAKWRELDLRHAGVIDRRGFVRLKRGPPPGSPERTDQPDTIA